MTSRRGIALAGISLAGSAAGLLGQVFLFRRFGATAELDLYYYCLAVPTFLAGQFALVMGYYLVPYLSREVRVAVRHRFQRHLLGTLCVLGLLASMPGIVAGAVLAPDLPMQGGSSQLVVVVTLSALAWLSVIAGNTSAAMAAFLNVRSAFVLPALFPLIPQAGMVLALVLSPDTGVITPLIGLNAGVLLACALGWMALREPAHGPDTADNADNASHWTEVRTFFRRAGFLPLVLSIFSAHFFVDALLVSQLPAGELSTLALAHRVNIGAVGVVVAAFASPMTAALSAAAEEPSRFRELLIGSLRRLFVYGAAVATTLHLNADFIAHMLVGFGKSSSGAAAPLADLIRAVAIAGLPMLIAQFLLRAMLASHLIWLSILAACTWAVIYLPGAVLLAPQAGATGLAFTYLAAWSVFCLCCLSSTRTLSLLRPASVATALGIVLLYSVATLGVRLVSRFALGDGPEAMLLTIGVGAMISALLALAIDRRPAR
jgi:peptidoglycan biosynthesis protein MviN/MurJ (putative lipid II flippase)